MSSTETQETVESVAIIGMSGRFPGAGNIFEFWRNLRDGVESIATFTDEELLAYGVDPELLESASYVRARGVLENIEWFDAAFFGLSPREAEIMDPQFRFFLETAWEAMEDSGYDAQAYKGVIGAFGGMSLGQYLLRHLMPNPEVVKAAGSLQLRISNDKDFLTTLVAYKLDLRGPTVNVQTACSTSLVAVHLACQSLLSYQCDMALAGGVSILVPQKSGYRPQEGVFSPDGHCRAFDADSRGTVSGNGVGVVVLKRFSDALNDRDHIHAIVKGSAINNDGSLKVSFTAPSIDGQAEVIAMAQAVAGTEPETISYIEAHGTGTPLGDPIEVAALTQVFRASTKKKGFCALGSVKTNVGHSDAAAGVTSLIKTVLALENKALPPSLNFERPNPHIDFANSPFFVNASLKEWRAGGSPRRAGVSAFAVGGTNAHVIVEEAPELEASAPSRTWQLILLSAKTNAALEAATDNLAGFLRRNANLNLADVAYTLQVGRRAFDHRRAIVCNEASDLVEALEMRHPRRVLTSTQQPVERPLAFMFPGLGNHYVNMGLELYQAEPVFRREVDRCCELLKPHLGSDLRDVIYPERGPGAPAPSAADANPTAAPLDMRRMLRGEDQDDETTRRLNQTRFSQPVLFVIEYALAQLWIEWGVKPQALIGYSIGEYVAACLAGVYSLEDALLLVARRAQLIQQLPVGAMLAVSLPAEEVQPLLRENLNLAAINGPAVCVVAGALQSVAELEFELQRRGVVARRLQTTHAFHSDMMEPIVESFTQLVKSIKLNPPSIPLISNVTGTWLTAAQARSPQYWATHLCRPILFGDGIQELWKDSNRVLLEVGPGQALGAWAMQHPESQKAGGRLILASLRHSYDRQSDQAFLLTTLGRLWLAGCRVDWPGFHAEEPRRRVALPSYPFERTRHWIEAWKGNLTQGAGPGPASLSKRREIADWFYLPSWKQARPVSRSAAGSAGSVRNHLVFDDQCGVSQSLIKRLRQTDQPVVTVSPGERFLKLDDQTFVINPSRSADYEALLGELVALQKFPQVICHLWSVTPPDDSEGALESSDKYLEAGFYSLLFLAQALGSGHLAKQLRLVVVANGLHSVSGEEQLCPAKAAVLGPCGVIPQEYPQLRCQSVDIVVPEAGTRLSAMLTDQLMAELSTEEPDPMVAYRGNHRWLETFDSIRLTDDSGQQLLLQEGGVYLITGGVGGIGLTLAEYIARQARGRLILSGRSAFPERSEWETWLAQHDEQEKVSRTITKLRSLEALGAEVLVVRADVTSREQMQQTLAAAREKFGRINGVIHAAGVPPGGMIQLKTPETAASVLAPKVKGTLLLKELLKDEQLDFFILCSSLSAITGAFGLVDHCGSNAFLDAFAQAQAAQGNHFVLSLNWDAWLEVGQAANAALSSGLQEILHVAHSKEGIHPLLGELLVDEPAKEVYSTMLNTARHWVVNEHRLMGNGVLPGTGSLEMVRAAFARHVGGRTIVMRKVAFLSPLIVRDGEVKEVRLILTRHADDGSYHFRIASRFGAGDNESQWQEHVTGRVTSSETEPAKKHSLAEILERLKPQPLDAFLQTLREDHSAKPATSLRDGEFKNLGPRWQNLVRRVGFKDGEGIAYLELSEEFADDLLTFKIHPSLMDAAVGFGQLAGEGVYLPLAYEALKIKGTLSRKLYSYVKYKESDAVSKDVLVCDLIIMDEDGLELIEVQEYLMRKITDPSSFGGTRRTGSIATEAAELPTNGLAQTNAPPLATAAATRVEGILPTEGAEAFDRILRSGLRVPRIAVSARELPSLIQQSRTLTSAGILEKVNKLQSQLQKHPRPDLQVPFVAARNELEQGIAAIWQEVLSIAEIGIHDNFFDTGGDSLIATLLVGRLSESVHVDLSLRTLFDAPTVAEMAVAIVQRKAEQVDQEALAELVVRIKNLSNDDVRVMLRDQKPAKS